MRIPDRLRLGLLHWAYRVMASRPPDYVIQPDGRTRYLERWRVIESRLFGVKVHRILRSDDDRALHDHPWPNLSIILLGYYIEHRISQGGVNTRRYYGRGKMLFRRSITAHRLEVDSSVPVVTLFLTGPRLRDWGFHCPNGWRPWQQFTQAGDKSIIGKGCA